MSRFGQVEMSQSRPLELRVLSCGDGRNSPDDQSDHDEPSRVKTFQAEIDGMLAVGLAA